MLTLIYIILYILSIPIQGLLWYNSLLNDFQRITVGNVLIFGILSLCPVFIVFALVIWLSSDKPKDNLFNKVLVRREK